MERARSTACVTGASGYLGSWLVQKLLEKGHLVHATLRNLGDESKTELLKSLPGADSRLSLFEADIYDAQSFEAAIQGCEFVFLVATPLHHYPHSSQYKNTIEAAVDAVRTIMRLCEQSSTVKRVIYTGSVTAASPLKEDGTGFKDFMDESCWTPLNLNYGYCYYAEEFEKSYVISKTLSEKEVLSYKGNRELEAVSLACALVGGETILPYVPSSMHVILSPLSGHEVYHRELKFLQAVCGSVPLVHIEDVCEAHTFCMEKPSLTGRFLCAAACPSMREIADYYAKKFPELPVIQEVEDGLNIQCRTAELVDIGFKYRYGVKQILDDSVECAT